MGLSLFYSALVLLLPFQAFARLGESIDSIPSDQKSMRAFAHSIKSEPLFSVHEIRSDSLLLKEFVDQNGTIFAITWSGMEHPDLEPLLGTYFNEYREADLESPRARGRRSRMLSRERFVLQTWGHPRNLHGRVLDPSRVPQGVTIEALR